MTVQITASIRTGTGWRVTWTSDQPSPTFYLWQNGKLASTTRQTSALFATPPDADLIVEIFDDPAARPAAIYSGKITLGWYRVEGAASYRIDEQISGNWVFRFNQPDNGGWYYTWKSRYLEDCQTHNFRITPVDTAGNDGDPVQTAAFIVRYPDTPAPAFAYNALTHAVTIS